MSTDATQTTIHAFYEFLGRRLASGADGLTPEESVREFQVYQEELNRFVNETQLAAAQSQRGEAKPLDVDAVMQRVTNRLENERGAS